MPHDIAYSISADAWRRIQSLAALGPDHALRIYQQLFGPETAARDRQAWVEARFAAVQALLRAHRLDEAAHILNDVHHTEDIEGCEILDRHMRADLMLRQGRYIDAISRFRQLLEAAEAIDKEAYGAMLDALGRAYAAFGEIDAALRCFKRSLGVKTARADAHGTAITHGNLGRLYQQLGLCDEARSHFEQDFALCHGLGDHASTRAVALQLVLLDIEESNLREARRRLKSLPAAPDAARRDPWGEYLIARLALAEGAPHRALQRLDALRHRRLRPGPPPHLLLFWCGECRFRQGERNRAAALWRRAKSRAFAARDRVIEAYAALGIARVLSVQEDFSRAIPWIIEACEKTEAAYRRTRHVVFGPLVFRFMAAAARDILNDPEFTLIVRAAGGPRAWRASPEMSSTGPGMANAIAESGVDDAAPEGLAEMRLSVGSRDLGCIRYQLRQDLETAPALIAEAFACVVDALLLQETAFLDRLTGVENRARFFAQIEEETMGTAVTGAPISVIGVDLDHFKQVNDTYGHAAGDAVLREAASRVRGALKDREALFRLGGEEFAVLLPAKGLDDARARAEEARLALQRSPVMYDGAAIAVSASLGVAQWRPQESIDMLLKRADDALYKAKASGRNQVACAQ